MKNSDYEFQQSYALIIGINQYENNVNLDTAVNDARRLKSLLEEKHGYTVLDLLVNADQQTIVDALDGLGKQVTNQDRLLFYFAGHGIADEEGTQGYLLPADAAKDSYEQHISMTYLGASLQALHCRHCLVLLDCCFSGAIRWSVGYRSVNMFDRRETYRQKYDQYLEDPAWQIITSAAYNEKAVDLIHERPLGARTDRQAEPQAHSPFALALFAALEGGADLHPKSNGVITATELYMYLREAVTPRSISVGKAITAMGILTSFERQTPSLFHFPAHDKGEYIFLTDKFRYSQLPAIEDYQVDPYKGLLFYDETESDIFYGREGATQELHEWINAKSLVVVSGASGTGKSSLIRAGLLPRLKEDGLKVWPLLSPGNNLMERIQAAIPCLADGIPEDTQALEHSVLVIDQYEEFVTQGESVAPGNEWDLFLTQLLDLAIDGFKVIILVRSDFEPQFSEFTHYKFWQDARYVVPPLTTAELYDIIEQPVSQRALFYSPEDLVRQIAEEVQQQPGSLPLLSFTLSEIYRLYLRDGFLSHSRVLDKKYYKQLGGVVGALQNRVNEIYAALSTTQQEVLRILLLRMVSIKGGNLSKRRLRQDELRWEDEVLTTRVQEILKTLVEERLVVAGTDSVTTEVYYEPAHDALVNAWDKVRFWLNDISINTFEVVRTLSDTARQYEQQAISEGASPAAESIYTQQTALWSHDPRLDMVKAFQAQEPQWFNAREQQFIANSIQRRQNIIEQQAQDLKEKENQLLRSNANEKSLEARLLVNENSTKALRLAEESVRLHASENGMTVLGEIFYNNFFYRSRVVSFPNDTEPYSVRATYYAGDRHEHISEIIVCDHNKILFLQSSTKSRKVVKPFAGDEFITACALSADKTYLLVAATHGEFHKKGALKLLRLDRLNDAPTLVEVFPSEINTISSCVDEEHFAVSGYFGVSVFDFMTLMAKNISLQGEFKLGDYEADDSNVIAVFNATYKKEEYYNDEKYLLVSRNGILKFYNVEAEEWLLFEKGSGKSFGHSAILYQRDYAFAYSDNDGKLNVYQYYNGDLDLVSTFMLDRQSYAQFFHTRSGRHVGVILGARVRFLVPTPGKITYDLLPQVLNGFENPISSARFIDKAQVLLTLQKPSRGAIELYYADTQLQLVSYKTHRYGFKVDEAHAPPKLIDRDNYVMKGYDKEENREVISFGGKQAEDVFATFSTQSNILNFDAWATSSEHFNYDIRLAILVKNSNGVELLVWHHFFTSLKADTNAIHEEGDYQFLVLPDLRYRCQADVYKPKWLYGLGNAVAFQSKDAAVTVVQWNDNGDIGEKTYRFPKQIEDAVYDENKHILYVLTEKTLHQVDVRAGTSSLLHESDHYKSSVAFNSTYSVAVIGISVTLGDSPAFYLVDTADYSMISEVKITSKKTSKNLNVKKVGFLNDHLICTLDEDSLKVWDIYTTKQLFEQKLLSHSSFYASNVKEFHPSEFEEELLILVQMSAYGDESLHFMSLRSPAFVLENDYIENFQNKPS